MRLVIGLRHRVHLIRRMRRHGLRLRRLHLDRRMLHRVLRLHCCGLPLVRRMDQWHGMRLPLVHKRFPVGHEQQEPVQQGREPVLPSEDDRPRRLRREAVERVLPVAPAERVATWRREECPKAPVSLQQFVDP
jgi:hypothetical protein